MFSLITAAVIITVAVVFATFLVSLAPEPASVEPPPQVPFVQTATVTSGVGAIPVYGAGTVRPGAEVGVAAQVAGRVVRVTPSFQSGGRVKKGQTLFHVEEADYLYRVQEAEASLAAYRLALLEEQEKAEIARAEYDRYADRQEDARPPAAGPLTLREPQLKAAEAALQRAEVRLAEARLALSRAKVKAPFDAYVLEESVAVGQIVAAGQVVGRLFAADAVEVVVPLSDREAALIPDLWVLQAGEGEEEGAPALVIARYGDGNFAWKGYVDRGEVAVDEQTRTIDVVVRVMAPFSAGIPVGAPAAIEDSPPLLVGEFVEVEISGRAPQSYFRAPRAALHPGNEVWVVDDTGALDIVPVQPLQRADDEVFITGDLQDGQTVVTGGIHFATDGMRVRAGK